MASGLFKKKQNNLSADLKDLSVSEAALSQSTYNVEKITDIQNRFRGGETLLVPGRIFIRDGVLWKVCRKGPKKRQFFLFNDVLVYGTIISRGHYGNQHIMSLGSMSVSSDCHYMPQVDLEGNDHDPDGSSPSELKPDNAFQINHSDKSFHVYSHSKADKGNWINNFNKQIAKITKNRNTTDHVYQRAVWVPDSASKQCMICKQKFSAFVRKHHCRMCGRVVCSACSPEKADIAKLSGGAGSSGKLERVCKSCKKPVILVTGGGVVGSEKNDDDDVITIATTTTTTTTTGVRTDDNDNDGNDSSETEDSDDSENEDTPVPPPRKKKQPNKSPEQQKKSGPPPRPSYTPAAAKPIVKKSVDVKNTETPPAEKRTSNDTDDHQPDKHTDSSTTSDGPTDSSQIQLDLPQPSPRTIVKSNSIPSKPARPAGVPPRSSSNSTAPKKPPIATRPPRPNSGTQMPVPKPRRTISKKDGEQESGSGSDTPTSMGSPSQNHKESEDGGSNAKNITDDHTTSQNELKQKVEPVEIVEPGPVQQVEPEAVQQVDPVDPVQQTEPDEVQQEEATEQTDSGQESETRNNNTVSEGNGVTHKQEDNEGGHFSEQSDQLEDSQPQDKEEVKPSVSKRRKQKITKPNELEKTPAVTNTPEPPENFPADSSSTNDTPTERLSGNATATFQEKKSRSPSTHARQRRSKFTTSQQ